MKPSLREDRRGATAIEYGLIAALVAVVFMAALDGVERSIESTMVTARKGLQGKVCVSDPLAHGTQCR